MTLHRSFTLALCVASLAACALPFAPSPPPDPNHDGVDLAVVDVDTPGNVQGLTPSDGEGFVAVHVRLQNATGDSEPIALIAFRAQNASGIETPATMTLTADDACAAAAFLSPGASVECSLVFSVRLDEVI